MSSLLRFLLIGGVCGCGTVESPTEASLLHVVSAAIPAEYVVLGTLGGPQSAVQAINEGGVITGISLVDDAFTFHVFVKTPNEPMEDLGSLPGFLYILPVAINNRGQIAGMAWEPGGHGFLWTPGVGFTEFQYLPGQVWNVSDLNEHGEIVGSVIDADWNERAFLWRPGLGMIDLGTLGGSYSAANGINDRGQVVGVSSTAAGELHAFIWDIETGMQDLEIPGLWNIARDISSAGVVVGEQVTSGPSRAFRWTREGGFMDLGFLHAAALKIASSGRILLTAPDETGADAFWVLDGAVRYRLPQLPGGSWIIPADLNSCGQAVGRGDLLSGEVRGILWRGSCRRAR